MSRRISEGRKDHFYYYRGENYRADGDCPRLKQRVLDYLGTAEEAIAKFEADYS